MAGSSPIFSTQLDKSVVNLDMQLKIKTGSVLSIHPKEYTQLVEIESTDMRSNKEMRYEGNGAAPEKAEGAFPSTTSMIESHIETTTQKVFAHDMPITWEARKFALKNVKIVDQMGEYQARSGVLRYEYSAAGILSNGFTASAIYYGADSQPYFSASHYWKSNVSATYSNLLAQSSFGKDTLSTALKTIEAATMEYGVPASLIAKMVTIGYNNVLELPAVLKSNLDPLTANNTYNVIQDYGLQKNLNHYWAFPDGYVIDTDVKTRKIFESEPTKLTSYIEPKSDNLMERVLCAFSTMFLYPVGSYGCNFSAS